MVVRLKIISALFLLSFTILLGRLFYWQIFKGKELSIQARSQYVGGQTITAPRGEILASDGSWFVARGESWLVYAELPKISDEKRKIAEKLAPYFIEDGKSRKDLLEEIDRLVDLLEKDGVVWIPLKNRVSSDVKKEIENFNIEGVGFERHEIRMYPEASTAAHLLGFVGKNEDGGDQGYFGLEGYYHLTLTGKTGYLSRESDARGVPILLGSSQQISAIGGTNLVTSIDKSVQLAADKRLKDGIKTYGAVGGSVIVAEPSTGKIMAMVSYPSYDPVEYYKYSDALFKNPVISSSFEPGSIFKVIIMASALDAGAVEPDTKCDICGGPLNIGKYYIKTWNNEYRADSTMIDVIVHSDNVGMAYAGGKLGDEKMYEYLQKFGIGELTGVDLQGEASPKLRDKNRWGDIDVATTSFGQGVAVTPIQLVRAVNAIANKGVITTPYIVDKLSGEGWEENVEVNGSKRIISEKSATQITAMMVEAARKGEAKWTHEKGFKVAGKTGTAQRPIEGHYDEERTIASFVGFAPFDKPKFLMLVTLHEPSTSPWASETAAPLWYSIAKDMFPYFGIHPEN
jgi:cell division protein FtsI/penicillin-binding protein 2